MQIDNNENTKEHFNNLQEITTKYGIVFDELHNDYEETILNIFNENYDNNIVLNEHLILNALGLYYKHVTKNYDYMEKAFLLAIDIDDTLYYAMNNLANYYYDIKQYGKMKKYYGLAIENNSVMAMCNFAVYYMFDEKNYDEMKKYFFMALTFNCHHAMCNLGYYYQYIEIDYDKMKKYYFDAIYFNNTSAMCFLGKYYYDNDNIDESKKFYVMAICLGDKYALYELSQKVSKCKLYDILVNIINKNDIIYIAISNLKNIYYVKDYVCKKKYKKSVDNKNYITCIMCYKNNVPCVQFDNCEHGSCHNCYTQNTMCIICNKEI